MDYLERINAEKGSVYYRLHGPYPDEIETYLFSSPTSRRIMNNPDIYGCEYTNLMEETMTGALKLFPGKEAIGKLDPGTISVIHFLRSGLNFGIRNGLWRAFGFNTHFSSFLTSQRQRDQYGRWYIKDDQYRKLEMPKDASFFIGEIVATGVTVSNGFDIIFHQAKNLGRPVRNTFFFTIGCHKIEKTLRKYDRLFRSIFPKYRKTYLIYLEGKFHLADSKTTTAIKVQGTDLMRHPALLAPEFELEQLRDPAYLLERCVIYDGGARAFNVFRYLEDVRSYWDELLKRADDGWTLKEAVRDRWPGKEYELTREEFMAVKEKDWKNIDPGILEEIYRTGRELAEDLDGTGGNAEALAAVGRRQLEKLLI